MAGLKDRPGPLRTDALSGRRMLMTGWAGKVDETIAAAFEAAGARVRRPPMLDPTAVPAWWSGAPCAEPARWLSTSFDEAEAALGGAVDILVLNRRRRVIAPVEKTSFETWRSLQSALVDHAFLAASEFARRLRLADLPGCVLTLIDGIALQGGGLSSATGAASAALENLTRCWSSEWAVDGIRANAVGYAFLAADEEPLLELARGRGIELPDTTPSGRITRADDLADMMLFLCSPYAAYITGTTMQVDGGEGLRHTLGGPAFEAPRSWVAATAST